MNIYFMAAIWLGMALFASFISIRISVSVALVEILAGAVLSSGFTEEALEGEYHGWLLVVPASAARCLWYLQTCPRLVPARC